LDAGSWEVSGDLGDLVLHVRTGRQIAKVADFGGFGPFAVGTVFLIHVRVDQFAHAVGDDAADADKDRERGKEDDDAGDADVGLLVACGGINLLGAVGAQDFVLVGFVVIKRGHV